MIDVVETFSNSNKAVVDLEVNTLFEEIDRRRGLVKTVNFQVVSDQPDPVFCCQVYYRIWDQT